MINCTHTTPHHISSKSETIDFNLLELPQTIPFSSFVRMQIHVSTQTHTRKRIQKPFKNSTTNVNISNEILYHTKLVKLFHTVFSYISFHWHSDFCTPILICVCACAQCVVMTKTVFDVDILKQSSSQYVPFVKLPLHSSNVVTFDILWLVFHVAHIYTCAVLVAFRQYHFATLYLTTFVGSE